MPLWDFVNRILALAGLPPVDADRVRRGSPTPAGAVLEGVYRLFRLRGEPPMTRFLAHQLSTAHWFDLTAARRDLGYTPHVSTADGLAGMRDWVRSLPG